MATGYDNRQTTRDTFAFQAGAPSQSQSLAQGASRDAQIVGGQSQGGAVAAGPQTAPGPVAGQLGEYFEGLMQPYIEKRQSEKIFEGFTAAQSGKAISEIGSSGKGISAIFGPTGFQKGAEFFTAQKLLSDHSAWLTANQDELAKMPPEEMAKLIAAKSQGMMTSDPFANQTIQAGLIESTAPALNTIAKVRYTQQQRAASDAQQAALQSAAADYQATMASQAKLSAPGDPESAGVTAARTRFLGLLPKPDGMTDATYKESLKGTILQAARDGNGHAVQAMLGAGIERIFDDEELTHLEDSLLKYGNRAMSQQAMLMAPRILALDIAVKRAGDGVPGSLSALDVMKQAVGINRTIKDITGFDQDLFDYKDVTGKYGGGVIDALLAADRRRQDRQWALQDKAQERAWKLEDEQTERDRVSAQVSTAWGMGNVHSALAAHLGTESDYDVLASQDYHTGNFAHIANAYNRDQYVSSLVANQLQAGVTASIGQGYTKDFQRSFGEWQALSKASPAAALAYYGKFQPMMQSFATLTNGKQMDPQAAFTRSFGDPARYSAALIPAEKRKDATAAIAAAVGGLNASWWNVLGDKNLTTSSSAVVQGLLADNVAIASQNTDLPVATIVAQQLQAAKANGSLERYGQFAWRNPVGTKPLARLAGMQPGEFTKTFDAVVDKKLKAAGYDEGSGGDSYDFTRMKLPDGTQAIHVQAYNADGTSKQTIVSLREITSVREHALDVHASRQGAGGLGAMRARGFDPNRPNTVPANWRTYPVKIPGYTDPATERLIARAAKPAR